MPPVTDDLFAVAAPEQSKSASRRPRRGWHDWPRDSFARRISHSVHLL